MTAATAPFTVVSDRLPAGAPHHSVRVTGWTSAISSGCGDDGGTTIIQQTAPADPPSGSLVVLTADNLLFFVSPSAPSDVTGGAALVGLAGEDLLAIDIRPATGDLYGYSSGGRLLFRHGLRPGRRQDPTRDRQRVQRAHGPERTDNVPGATTTTLYGIDPSSDMLVRIGGVDGTPSPNGGAVTSVGPLGVGVAAEAEFGIAPSGEAYAALEVVSPHNIASMDPYRIDLATGAATRLGTLGSGGPVRGIAVVP